MSRSSRTSLVHPSSSTIRRHLKKYLQSAEKSELLLAAEVEKRAALSHELETAKGEIHAQQDSSPISPVTVKSTGAFYNRPTQSSRPTSKHITTGPWPTSALDVAKDATESVRILQLSWPTIPSLKARAARLSGGIRALLRWQQPDIAAGASGRTRPNAVSFSYMDVRALKSFYSTNDATPSTPEPPHSSLADGTTAALSVEAFALRIQAFITDDRGLIERLIRLAHAHNLLKKNAGRVQKRAQDSTAALETYQRQVRPLEGSLLSWTVFTGLLLAH